MRENIYVCVNSEYFYIFINQIVSVKNPMQNACVKEATMRMMKVVGKMQMEKMNDEKFNDF